MKLGVMQPYFCPYLGYYSLIKHCDRFVLFDTVQFIKNGWINRNRVLKPVEGWQYVTVPVRRESMHSKIHEVLISEDPDWKGLILRQLEHYKKRAPFYREVVSLLDEALDTKERSIARLNLRFLKASCDYLGLKKDMGFLSEMGIKIENPKKRGEFVLQLNQALGASEYVNMYGGVELFDLEEYHAAGVPISFIKNNLKPYDQRRETFEPGLSIVDVLMFNDPQSTNALIDDYVTSPTGKFP